MTVYPTYQDVITIGKLNKEQLPFLIRHVTIYKRTRLHHHDFAELALVVEGHGTEIINGQPHELRPGSITFLLPHHIHELRNRDPETPLQVYNCLFDISMVITAQIDPEFGSLLMHSVHELPSYTDLDPETFSEMKAIYQKLLQEYAQSGLGRNSYIRAKLLEALVLYVRSRPTVPVSSDKETTPGAKHNFWEIIQYVHTHYTHNLDSKMISDQFGVSVSSIHRSFKKHMGQGLQQYMHALRIRRASGLLIATEMSIHDVAVEVGFESYRTFSRIFKELTGMTPSDYRLSYSNKS